MDLRLLKNGTLVEIREIRPDDGERLRASHARLSPESRYKRFLGAKPTLTEADARYLADIDGHEHYALVATATVEGRVGEIIAVARFIALPGLPGTAEFAVVVGDAYQGQGLADAMLDRLVEAALARGITRLRAVMLSDNLAIRRMFARIAHGPVASTSSGSVTELEVALTASEPLRRGLDVAA